MNNDKNLTSFQETISLWSKYICVYNYTFWEFDKEKIKNAVYSELKKQKKDIESDVSVDIKTPGVKEGTFDFLKKKEIYPVLTNLENFFKQSVYHAITKALPDQNPVLKISENINLKVIITDCWYHVTNNNGSHSAHTHPGHSWAGIFYVQSSECSPEKQNGINRWYNDQSALGIGDAGSFWWHYNNIIDIIPKNGRLVLFPAWLLHDVTPYIGKEDRIVISFNSLVVNDIDR